MRRSAATVSGANGGLDVHTGALSNTSQTSYSLPSGALAQADEVLFGGFTTQSGTGSAPSSHINGFTRLGTNAYQDFAAVVVSSASSIAYGATWNGTVNGEAVLASFKATAAGAPAAKGPMRFGARWL